MLLFVPFLRKFVRRGRLIVVDALGHAHRFEGQPQDDLRPVTIRLHRPALHWQLPLSPGLVAGEAYMDGSLTIEDGSLYDLIALASANEQLANPDFSLVECLTRRFQQWNPLGRARSNASHHYDIPEDLYSLFLDPDRQYSCGYFPHPGMSLEEAQSAKKRHLMAKLLLEPGQRVLDIGCGWGGLALTMAGLADVEVTGITLSQRQLAVARQRAEQAQLSHRVNFQLTDYRQVTGRFDRIVSVGMFEHVGYGHYHSFFRRIGELLAHRGVGLIHAIGRSHGPGNTNAWIRKYIFPGGYSPALSDVMPAVEQSGLLVTDLEILHGHYAETLRHWRHRFAAHRQEAAALMDERFCRMWEFYLAGAESAFHHQGHMVWQMQLAAEASAVPPNRDYIWRAEQSYPQS